MYRSNRTYKVNAIVIARKNRQEADKIITVFSKEYGKMRLLAKGIRKISSKRAAYLEVFSHVSMVVYAGSGIDTITEVSSISQSRPINLESVSVAYFYCELINVLMPERQEHGDVYDLLANSLQNVGLENLYAQSKQFTLTLLRSLGYLEQTKELHGKELQAFIESITERRLRTPSLIRQLL